MAGKNSLLKRIDAKLSQEGGETTDSSVEDFTPLTYKSIDIPDSLTLDTDIVRAAFTPEANIIATWNGPNGVLIDQYIVQVSEDNTFPTNNTKTLHTAKDQEFITITGLKTGTEYNVRVAALGGNSQSDFTDYETITTVNDLTPCGPVTSASSDFTGRDLLLTWSNPINENFGYVRVDIYASGGGPLLRTFNSSVEHYTYLGSQNLLDTSGIGDPSLSVTLTAVTRFGIDTLTPVTLTPTNGAPIAPTVNVLTGFAQLYGSVTSDPPNDFASNEFVWKNGLGITVQTTLTASSFDIYQVSISDTYSLEVRVIDIYGNASSITTETGLVIDTLTIISLREESFYSDSISTNFSSNPNKTVLKDDTTGAGITYAASASAYRYTKIEYPLTERFRRISLKLGSGSANFYVGISSDDITYTFYSGSVTSGYILTNVANEAAAQAAAPLFSALTYGYAELPTTVEGRFVKIFHRNTTLSYRLDEGYGQRIVIADVIKAGDIQTIHLAVGSVIADRISVTSLSAISADLGSITAGIVTGATIRTAASGARLQLTSSAFEGYTASDKFFQIEPTDGITIYANSTLSTIRAYTFRTASLTLMGGLYGIEDTLTRAMELSVVATTKSASMSISSEGLNSAGTGIQASSSAGEADIQVSSDSVFGNTIDLNADKTTVSAHMTIVGGLNLAGATSAGNGKIRSNQYTLGSVLFQGASNEFSQDNANFFWDDTNNRLGIGNAAPATTLHITGTIRSTVGLTLDFITAGSIYFGGASGVLTQDNSNLFWDDTNNKLFIGTNAQGNGIGKIVLKGTDSNVAGPHIETITSADDYPIVQLLSFTHDNIELSFDAYYNSAGVWKSSDAGSNFQIRKNADQFGIWSASGVSAGNTITWLANDLMETTGVRSIIVNSAITNTVAQHQFYHRTSGTPAANFGLDIITSLNSATVADRTASLQRTTWTTATDASRKALEQWFIYDTSFREAFRIAASGTAPQIGFLGANASARIAVSAAAPANGAGITAGAFDTAAHRDALITLVNDLRTVLITNGLAV